jgi:GINS complex subunit 3
MSYYDIDDILAEAEVLPCVFNTDGVDLGYLDLSTQHADLKKNAKVELPYWLTTYLADRNYVKLDVPSCFGNAYRIQLLADPRAANLKDRCFYFYELGLKIAILINDATITDMLQVVLASRLQDIIIREVVHRNTDFNNFTAKLSNVEEKLFDIKYRSAVKYERWLTGQSSKIAGASQFEAASGGGISGKRKR